MSPGEKELNFRASCSDKPSQKTQRAPQSCSTAPWRGRDGTGCAAREELYPRLRSLLSSVGSRGTRSPPAAPGSGRWVQNSAATAPNTAQGQSRPISASAVEFCSHKGVAPGTGLSSGLRALGQNPIPVHPLPQAGTPFIPQGTPSPAMGSHKHHPGGDSRLGTPFG